MKKISQLPEGPYDAQSTEPKILRYWLEENLYKPEIADRILKKHSEYTTTDLLKNQYTIINPPPNAYARPHMGNVSGYAYQDMFGRRARLQGKSALLFPGKDHAAQQAEIVYTKEVLTPKGKKKDDFTREEFYKDAYDYFTEIMKIAQIDEQTIGLSSDFSRDLFTLDPRVAATVFETFAKMWKDKMVYKGVRVVNWSPGLNSAVADIDTERLEIDSKMYYLKYVLPDSAGDALNLRDTYKDNTTKIKITKVIEQKDEKLKLAKIKIDDADFTAWLNLADDHKTEDDSFEVVGLSIPLHGEIKLILATPGSNVSYSRRDYIFKSENKNSGSSFQKFFKFEVDNLEIEYGRSFVVGTVRPETLFGDTALVFNPSDSRFSNYLHRNLKLIGLNGIQELKIISDGSIDKEFGTGIMKLTPAHSPTDYEIYLRHNQNNPNEQIGYLNVIEKNGLLNKLAGKAKGLHAEEDREKIVKLLENGGLLVHTEAAKSSITICERTKTVIQPIMSSQWFIDTDRLKIPAIDAINKEEVKIHPQNMTKKLVTWLENLRDWPISRSIWWGYRIPVWYKGRVNEFTDDNGQLKVKIGEVEIDSMQDAVAKGLMKIELGADFTPVLIPGRYDEISPDIYSKLKKAYPWAKILPVKNIVDPNYSDYRNALLKVNFDANSVVVAHSLGSLAILHYLSEEKINIKKLILLAPSNRESMNYDHYVENGFWDINFDKISEQISEGITVIYSNTDKLFSIASQQEFAAKVGAEVRMEEGQGHYVGEKGNYRSEILEKLLAEYARKTDNSIQQMIDEGWVQDEDVFDTWFSSGQWPFATLSAEGLMKRYPTDLLETGFDILELWVSRMIMLGIYMHDEVPFRNVYLHGLIKAEDGQKMSKSKGNIVYTEDIINEYGADTLRMFYIVGNKAGASYRVDRRKIKGYRNFLNKVWNAGRFILQNTVTALEFDGNNSETLSGLFNELDSARVKSIRAKSIDLAEFKQVDKNQLEEELAKVDSNDNGLGDLSLKKEDLMMLKSMASLRNQVDTHMDKYRPGMAAEEIIQHFWHTFADIYLEVVKGRLYTVDKEGNPINTSDSAVKSRYAAMASLLYCFKEYLILLHPFTPFITEELWQNMPDFSKESASIMYANWPKN